MHLVMQTVSNKLAFIEKIFGKGILAPNGKNFNVRCPICAPSDLNKRKLAIRVVDDAHHCWTCGWKAYSLAPLIRKYGTTSQLSQYKNEFAFNKRAAENKQEIERPKVAPLPSDFKLLGSESITDPDYKAAWNYLKNRQISLRDAWHYKLGISNDPRWKRRIIIPSFDGAGDLNFYVSRNIDSHDRRTKYDNPDDDKNQIIFNEINLNWEKRIVICEGPFDMMKCGDNATCLLGSDLSQQSKLFSQILLHGTPVALALDGDMWNSKTPRLAKLFQGYDIDVTLVDTRSSGDPGSMTKQSFKNALLSASHPTWEGMFFDRLDKISQVRLHIN